MEGLKEECRESRRVHIVDTFLQDVRYGVRMLRKSPGFTLAAVLTLALGMGANTTIFSTMDAMLLHPLNFPDLDRLVAVSETLPHSISGTETVAPPIFWIGRNKLRSLTAWPRISHGNLISPARENLCTSQARRCRQGFSQSSA